MGMWYIFTYLPTSLTDAKSKYHFFFKLDKSASYSGDILSTAYDIYKCIMAIPKVGALFDSEKKRYFLMHLATHHFLIRNTNPFGNEEGTELGNVLAIANHSCTPNLSNFSIAGKQFCITVRPVKKGAQLFVNYMAYETTGRQKKLLSNWGFLCKCERCHPSTKNIDKKLMTSDPHYQFVMKNQFVRHLYNTGGSIDIQKKCIQFFDKYGHQWSNEIQEVTNIYNECVINFFMSNMGC